MSDIERVDGLPKGLSYDKRTGRIVGKVAEDAEERGTISIAGSRRPYDRDKRKEEAASREVRDA